MTFRASISPPLSCLQHQECMSGRWLPVPSHQSSILLRAPRRSPPYSSRGLVHGCVGTPLAAMTWATGHGASGRERRELRGKERGAAEGTLAAVARGRRDLEWLVAGYARDLEVVVEWRGRTGEKRGGLQRVDLLGGPSGGGQGGSATAESAGSGAQPALISSLEALGIGSLPTRTLVLG